MSQERSVDLAEIRPRYATGTFAQLIERMIHEMNDKQLSENLIRIMGLIPPDVVEIAAGLTEAWNIQAYNLLLWQTNAAMIFDGIIADMKERLAEAGIEPNDEICWDAFRVIALNFAIAASKQRGMRKFMGIRKGIFG